MQELPIEVIVQYPKQARAGVSYIMSVDLAFNPELGSWPFSKEEIPIYCLVSSPLFNINLPALPVFHMHRFGGTYGALSFRLKALDTLQAGEITLLLINNGMPVCTVELQTEIVDKQAELAEVKEVETVPVSTAGGPGYRLVRSLEAASSQASAIKWSPDGRQLAVGHYDGTIWVWRVETGTLLMRIIGHAGAVLGLAWKPDAQTIISFDGDGAAICFWDAPTGRLIQKLDISVESLALSPDGLTLAASSRRGDIHRWDLRIPGGAEELPVTSLESGIIRILSWSPDGRTLAWGSMRSIGLGAEPGNWSANKIDLVSQLHGPANVRSIAWSPDGRTLATGFSDQAIRLWDVASGILNRVLEGHTDEVTSLSFSGDGRLLASCSAYGPMRIWRCDRWESLLTLNDHSLAEARIEFHPRLPLLASPNRGHIDNQAIDIWELDTETLLALNQAPHSVGYATARVVLVGDSGVGKTGLGWRLAHGEFKDHSSTHGQQFWAIPQLRLKRKDGTECEAVLWDLAGQHIYRQIHSIFLENIAAALVLFDPSNRQDPLKGVQFWLEQLKGKGQLPPVVLVGARVDRGSPALAQQELEQFCQRYGIRGGYISTSALSGEGLDTLLDTLKAQIPWEEMTATVTTVTFKRIKDYVLSLKEKPDRRGVLVSPRDLREHLQETDKDWRFTDAEMMTAVMHLETHGYVAILHSSGGEQYVLLAPDLLVTVASSIVLLADKNPRELGAVSETELLQGQYPFDELAGLPQGESQILLDAAILRFLQHNICFRETLGGETLLIFPGLIKQKRPLQDDLPATDDISYVVRGRVENLYAGLVVLLGNTPSFTRINQWQNQAQYEMGEGEICGFRLIEDREGEVELVLYYSDKMPPSGRPKFQELFEQFLYQRDVEVTRFPPVVCANGHRQKRATVIERVRERKPFMFCYECGDNVALPDFDKPQSIALGASPWLQREEAAARLRSAYEVQLTRVKSYRRAWSPPRCYLSRLPEQEALAEELIHDLRGAGVFVVEQADQVESDDFVIVLDTPAYQKAFNTPALADDTPLVRARLGKKRRPLISLALTGQGRHHEFQDCKPGNFYDETHYIVSLFDLVLALYAIPLTHAGFAPLRQALHEQWEQAVWASNQTGVRDNLPLKVCISYAHKDEPFKNELLTALKSLEHRGVLEIWYDRKIEEGDEWRRETKKVLTEGDMVLLLISKDFLASSFIQDRALPLLLQRRKKEGLSIVPIIISPCMWKSEQILADLQVLPKDDRPVISFRKGYARDHIWTEIAQAIEKRARAQKGHIR